MSDGEAQQAEAPFVLPTQVAVARYLQMKVESILNTPYQVTGEMSPVAHCLQESGDAEETAELLNLPEDQHEIAIDLLEDALEGGDLEEVYGLRGGALNILMPMAHEEQDRVLYAIEEELEGAPELSAFLHAPNELFSALTPAEVWVGTGKIEMALADLFLRQSWLELKEKSFPAPGAANTEWLSRLRLWSYNPAQVQNYRGRVVDLIKQERRENLASRVEWSEARGIDVMFKPLE
ncbi:MAG: hypothetical protein CMH57_08645 [Myxococcales bacterium]|nr:hypothetical protein [Myxococcales bacterium]